MDTAYKASLDKLCKIVTAIVGVVFVLMTLLLWYNLPQTGIDLWVTWFAFIAMIALFVFTYLLAPRSYRLTANTLIIERYLKPVSIPLQQIEAITAPTIKDFTTTLRLFGSGGLWGYFGLFWNTKQGKMYWYATQLSNLVMLKMQNGHPIILTPDDPNFTLHLQQLLNQHKK